MDPASEQAELKNKSPLTILERKETTTTNPAANMVTPDNKLEEASAKSKRLTPPPTAPSPTNSVRSQSHSHPPPIITNSVPNRPPSTTSVHSNGSGANPRVVGATSRRGGRTRSRSPPMMVQRPSSTGPSSEAYPGPDARGPPPSPANPSAAAAAAAAAAKSITRNPPPPSSWYDSPEARERDFRRSRGEPGRYRGRYYEGGPPPPSSRQQHQWSEEAEGGARAPPMRNRYPPRRPGEEYYGYRGGEGYPSSSYRGRGGRGEPYPPPYEEDYESRGRYRDQPPHRYEDGRPRSTSPKPPGSYDYRGRDHSREHRGPSHHPHGPPPPHVREDPYYGKGPKEQDGARAESGAPSSLKRTTRVIGTATPIHMPRAPEPASRGGSSARSSSGSIFRGRPGAEVVRKPPPGTQDNDEDNPQKILMALRTPSGSFEEQQQQQQQQQAPKTEAKRGTDPLSPEAPPQIQHSHHASATDSSLFFEPQRSPKSTAGPPQQTNSLEMAPSFTLFNQSFDSIGDTANFFNVSGPLDSTLQSSSFGAGPISSEDKGTELQLSASGGTFSQQLLGGSSSAGNLTFGMSPNNSFGNGPSSSLRSGNMMVLGGQDHRSASPSQVLDMYRSYSGGGAPSPRPNKGPLEDSHTRMSGGSLGNVPSLSNSYTRSFGEAAPGQFRSNSMGHPDTNNGGIGFYTFLKRHKGAFKECSFLLPGLKAALLQAPDVKLEGLDDTPKRHTRSGDPYEPNPQDIAIALRRVASAVCAFGGTFQGERSNQQQAKSASNQSIFREKPGDTATVTPTSSTSTSPGSQRSRQRAKYDEMLPGRYYENDNRLSWEFEENPPIEEKGKDEEEADEGKKDDGKDEDKSKDDDKKKNEDEDGNSGGSESGKKTPTGSKEGGDQPKMRYRCKLCGQPKQNHVCPYQQSLARSIGTMVYPAVNAFTSAEPGSLAPALSEMNNFIVSSSESVSSADTSPSRPTPDRLRRLNQGLPPGAAQVTPESLRGASRGMTSPVTTPTRSRSRMPGSSRRSRPGHDMQRRAYLGATPTSMSSSSRKKRSHGQMSGADGTDDQGELLFVETMDLKPEQFRMVTSSKIVSSRDAFTYPALPLPYAQRKRLSDNLFSLSKEVPQLTDECAAVLREAREKDLWDLAVAELMTQVVVVVHCHDNDSRFEGLRRYLLTLGISC